MALLLAGSLIDRPLGQIMAADPPARNAHESGRSMDRSEEAGPVVAAEKTPEKKSRFFSRVLLPVAGAVLAIAAVYFLFFNKKDEGGVWDTNVKLDGSDSLGSGVVGMWSFNGNCCSDGSANANHGLAVGGPTFVPGVFGSAVSLNGSSDFVLVTEKGAGQQVPSVLRSLKQGTISLWFKVDDYPAQIYPLIHFGSATPADGASLIIEIGHNLGGGQLYFTVLSCMNKVLQCFNSTQEMSCGTWHHFVATVQEDGDNQGFNTGYLDGVEMADRHYNVGTTSQCAYFFDDLATKDIFAVGYGRFGMTQSFFYAKSAIDELVIWDRVLSAADVSELYRRSQSAATGESRNAKSAKNSALRLR